MIPLLLVVIFFFSFESLKNIVPSEALFCEALFAVFVLNALQLFSLLEYPNKQLHLSWISPTCLYMKWIKFIEDMRSSESQLLL